MLVKTETATLPGHSLRQRTSLVKVPVGLWDLTGGSAERCIQSLVNSRRLTIVGSPEFTPLGVICDASNYLESGIAGGAAQLSYAVVAQRTPSCVYVGNLNTGGESDSLIESSAGDTRSRYWNGVAINLDIDENTPHPAAYGEFFFAACSFASSTNLLVARMLVEAEATEGVGGRTHVSTTEINIGRGGASAFTSTEVLISMVGIWEDTLNSNEKAEQYHIFRRTVEQNGVFC